MQEQQQETRLPEGVVKADTESEAWRSAGVSRKGTIHNVSARELTRYFGPAHIEDTDKTSLEWDFMSDGVAIGVWDYKWEGYGEGGGGKYFPDLKGTWSIGARSQEDALAFARKFPQLNCSAFYI